MGRSRDLADGTLAELNVDSNTLAVDSTNNRVGIGTASPSQELHIYGTGGVYTQVENSSGTGVYGVNTNGDVTISAEDASNNIIFMTGSGASERMRIDSSGNVGIGTTVTTGQLNVSKSGGNQINVIDSSGSSPGIRFANSSNTALAFIEAPAGNGLSFFSGATERARITDGGAFIVGTDTVTSWTSNSANIGSKTSAAGQQCFSAWNAANSGTRYFAYFGVGSTFSAVGSITSTGSTTAYNTSSDYRLKENVIEVTDGIDRVKLLKPSRFNFIADPDTTVDGFLAHEVADVVPEAITGTKDEVDDDGNPKYQGIDQSKLVPLLTAALQEAITKIESLETEMITVKSRLDALESA